MTDLEDPLEGYSGLSLFPRTLASLSTTPQPSDLNDPHSIHNFLKSLPVRNPGKLIEQAKTILDDSTGIPSAKTTNDVVLEDKNDVVAKAVDHPRGQRPGLGRKRPRFSLLPNISQPTVNLEPTLDFDKLKDPEEFFLAYERLENAKKEIAKQTGHAFTDSDKYNVFMVPRSQRPGIPGRSRMTKYKHLYPTMPSQETPEKDIPSSCDQQQEQGGPDVAFYEAEPANAASQQLVPTNDASQQTELATVASEKMELADSEVKAENSINKLLDEFLSNNYEELEGDGAISILQDHLEIRPLHIEKLSLPDLPDIQRINFKTSRVNLPKHRNVLSDINNLLNGTKNITPINLQNTESSVPSFGSPTPPKSPLASLSLLKRLIFQSNLSSDPFSTVDIDQPSARNATPVEVINKDSDPVDVEKTLCVSGDLNSLKNKEDDGTIVARSSTMASGDFTSSFEKLLNESSLRLASGSVVGVCTDYDVINENLSQADAVVDHQENGPNEPENKVEDVMQEGVASEQSDKNTDEFLVEVSNSIQYKIGQSNLPVGDEVVVDGCADIQDIAPGQIQKSTSEQQNEQKFQEPCVVSTQKQSKAKLRQRRGQYNKAQSRRRDLAVVEDQEMDGCSEFHGSTSNGIHDTAQDQIQATSPEKQNEKIQESSVVSMNERIKAPNPSKERKSKILSRRQSLAGCGMSWETGVRRSTRIRSRPLEYWKGERFLYGRIHKSLATIIGIKYESPQKDQEKPTMKVKSFVSDEYRDLVEQAALY